MAGRRLPDLAVRITGYATIIVYRTLIAEHALVSRKAVRSGLMSCGSVRAPHHDSTCAGVIQVLMEGNVIATSILFLLLLSGLTGMGNMFTVLQCGRFSLTIKRI